MKARFIEFQTSITTTQSLINKVAKLSAPIIDGSLDHEKIPETTAEIYKLYAEIFRRLHADCVKSLGQRQFSRIEKDKPDPNGALKAVIPLLKKLSDQLPLTEEEIQTAIRIRLNAGAQIRRYIFFQDKVSKLYEISPNCPRP